MKTTYLVIVITFLCISCGNKKEQSIDDILATNDLTKIRAKKVKIDEEQQKLAMQVKQLSDKISELDSTKKVPLVSTFIAKENVFTHYVELQGNVQTKQNVLVLPEMSGVLQHVYVKEGQMVVKGAVLGKIDDAGLSNQLAQVESAFQLAKTTYNRQKRLWSQKIGSEIQYLQAKTNYESQKNAVLQLKKQLDKANIKAPFSGIVDDVLIDEGTFVSPNTGLGVFRIVNLNNMFIETDVPESYVSSIVKGKSVKVEFPVLGKEIETKIRQAGNFINPANRTFKIEVPVTNKENTIKPNLTAKLSINDYTNEKALLIPQSIISEDGKGEQYIYVVSDVKKVGNKTQGLVKRVTIKTGKTQGDVIEILEGLFKGNQIIEEGARSVKEGQIVNISDK